MEIGIKQNSITSDSWKASSRNVRSSLLSRLIRYLFTFIFRLIFAHCFSVAYLGTHDLLGNTIKVLAMAELGLNSTLAYALYKPLLAGNLAKARAILRYYQQHFRYVASGLALLFALAIPLYGYLVGDLRIDQPYLIYLLFALDTVCSYCFATRRIALDASLQQHVDNYVTLCAFVVTNILQFAVLIYLHSYLGYLLLKLANTLAINIYLHLKAAKKLPALCHKQGAIEPLTKAEHSLLKRDLIAVLWHLIGDKFILMLDTLAISWWLDVSFVGIYTNYFKLLLMASVLISMLFNALQSTVGTLTITASARHKFAVFCDLSLVLEWLLACTICGFYLFCQPLVELAYGSNFLLAEGYILLLLLSFYLTTKRRVLIVFKTIHGMFYQDRLRIIPELFLRLLIASIGGYYLGLSGIILASIIGTLALATWIEPLLLYRQVFFRSVKLYFVRYALDLILFFVLIGLSHLVASWLPVNVNQTTISLVCNLTLRFLFVLSIPTLLVGLSYSKTPSLFRVINLLKTRLFN